MGWAINYSVKWGRALSDEETRALEEWAQKYEFRLEPVGDSPALQSWKGLVPDEVLERKVKRATPPRLPGADYEGFQQLNSEAAFKKFVRMFQELERRFPFAELLLTDDFHVESARPSTIDLKNLPTRGAAESAHPPPPVPDDALEPEERAGPPGAEPPPLPEEPPPSPEALRLRDEVEQALERARKDFAIWKGRAKK